MRSMVEDETRSVLLVLGSDPVVPLIEGGIEFDGGEESHSE